MHKYLYHVLNFCPSAKWPPTGSVLLLYHYLLGILSDNYVWIIGTATIFWLISKKYFSAIATSSSRLLTRKYIYWYIVIGMAFYCRTICHLDLFNRKYHFMIFLACLWVFIKYDFSTICDFSFVGSRDSSRDGWIK